MSDINYSGKVAIVTGAGNGLGKSYALELAKRGAKVIVNDLGGGRDGIGNSATPADEVVDEIKEKNGEAVANYDNVATLEGGENILKTALDAYGKVDILINNAGILRDRSFGNLKEDDWDSVCAVHMKGAYCVTKPVFSHMRQNKYGRIVMTASAAGIFGNFGQTNYSAAKMGIVGLTNSLKLEGAKYNITVNAIVPGAATRLTEDVLPKALIAKMKVDYVTPMVMYLCSEDCKDTGMYINAFSGYYSRSAIVTSPGFVFNKSVPTAEEVMKKWDEITSLDNSKFFNNANEMMEFVGSSVLFN